MQVKMFTVYEAKRKTANTHCKNFRIASADAPNTENAGLGTAFISCKRKRECFVLLQKNARTFRSFFNRYI